VEFYVNGVLVASDTTSPYLIYWSTRRAAAANVIQAVAYDTSGNRTVAQVTAYTR
jgi:large repetitive protein